MNIINRIRNKYDLYAIRKYKEIDGWLSPNEALELYRLAALVPQNGIIVEIGSWKGKSTYCLAKGVRNGKVFTIDPFDASAEEASAKLYEEKKGNTPLLNQFQDTMSTLGVIDKIIILHGYSSQYVNSFQKIDLLFIDGDHSLGGCNYDYDNFSHYILRGGYIVFHDYNPERNDLGPTDVVNNKVMKSGRYAFLKQTDSLWIGQKK